MFQTIPVSKLKKKTKTHTSDRAVPKAGGTRQKSITGPPSRNKYKQNKLNQSEKPNQSGQPLSGPPCPYLNGSDITSPMVRLSHLNYNCVVDLFI
jgi:hypothetical protein